MNGRRDERQNQHDLRTILRGDEENQHQPPRWTPYPLNPMPYTPMPQTLYATP